jgi:hypothetical protein
MPGRFRSPTLLVGASLLVLAPAARAGNDDELFVGNEAAMAGGVAMATVADSSATWYNPAGLGAVGRDQIDVSGTAYTLRFYSAPGFMRSSSGDSDDASVIEFLSSPSQVALVRRLGEGVSLGLGYFVPQASNLLLRESLDLRRDGVDSNFQFTLRLTRIQHTAAIGLGAALNPRVRAGFSVVGTYEDATESISIASLRSEQGRQTSFLVDSVLGTFARAGLELAAGFQFDLRPSFRLGLAARSPRVLLHQSTAITSASGSAQVSGGTGAIEGALTAPSDTRTGFDVVRAGRLGFALAYLPRPGDWVAFELDVQPAVHSAGGAGVNRTSVVNARLGAYHRTSDSVALGAGLFTDRSPDLPNRDVVNGRGHFYGATLGIELSNKHRLDKGERADSLELSSTFALRYAFSNGTLNGLAVSSNPTEPFSSSTGRLLVHEIGLYVGGGLGF